MAEDAALTAAWIARFQAIEAPAELWSQPAANAARLCTLVDGAARSLPFGAEPPEFLALLEALAPKGPGDGE